MRVGKKPNLRCKNGGFFRQNKKNPSLNDVGRMKVDYYGHFTLDEDGLIKEIGIAFNGC